MIKSNSFFNYSPLHALSQKLCNRFSFPEEVNLSKEEISYLLTHRINDFIFENGSDHNKVEFNEIDSSKDDHLRLFKTLLTEKLSKVGNTYFLTNRTDRVISTNGFDQRKIVKINKSESYDIFNTLLTEKLHKAASKLVVDKNKVENSYTKNINTSASSQVNSYNQSIRTSGVVTQSAIFNKDEKKDFNQIISNQLEFRNTGSNWGKGQKLLGSGSQWMKALEGNKKNLLSEKILLYKQKKDAPSTPELILKTNPSSHSAVRDNDPVISQVNDIRLIATGGKEKLTDNDWSKVLNTGDKEKATRPVYHITQNFGDIVIHPSNMEVGAHQLKGKLEDILRKVRDSLH